MNVKYKKSFRDNYKKLLFVENIAFSQKFILSVAKDHLCSEYIQNKKYPHFYVLWIFCFSVKYI
ncbi:MAG: hypothetical protein COT61_04175 [Candidatus Portnoybacteria bacterium CG09_land_8_20_14_0_10_44_13]|uniref:Uncharacterized protein n=2 Tax=Candidatus Portnoyibacteriota TaxID=1817913 RepID=A0A2H0WWT3_9BACT|nr:MAG: hypothetical protein COT61_04175 [Candidatus Portnoybacteria bacterium CG09_land_8_20_14_0_10_44_13]PIZ72433.1 MAG: hypothetical protein COY11_00310 [Candidatus Portnoybacteria bacterium CG_4_10_14_0_2_um_filter_44_20]